MKITRMETMLVKLPARRKHPTATGGTGDIGRYPLLRVCTDEGVVGWGEATVLKEWGGDHGRYFGETPQTTRHVIEEVLAPALVGLNPFEIDRLHQVMDRAIKGYPYAKAAVDIACLDIKGKVLGVPVFELLGGLYRDLVPIAHSLGILDTAEMVREACAAVEEGIRTIKVKVGLDPERDVRIVKELRQALGDEVDITVDANQGYRDPRVAIRTIKRMEESGILFVEQPVEGIRGLAQIVAAVDTPVMADESAWNEYDVLDLIWHGAADLVSIYTTKPGGLSRAKRVAAVAEAGGLSANVNGSHETGVGNAANLHLAASTPVINQASVLPVSAPAGRSPNKIAGVMYLDDIVTEPFAYREGCLVVPKGPGLGVEIDEARLARYRVG